MNRLESLLHLQLCNYLDCRLRLCLDPFCCMSYTKIPTRNGGCPPPPSILCTPCAPDIPSVCIPLHYSPAPLPSPPWRRRMLSCGQSFGPWRRRMLSCGQTGLCGYRTMHYRSSTVSHRYQQRRECWAWVALVGFHRWMENEHIHSCLLAMMKSGYG